MLPRGLSIKETIIYSALPSGYTNTVAVHNLNPTISSSNLSRAFRSLCENRFLSHCTCSLKNPSTYKSHSYDYYLITPRGIQNYFKLLSSYSPPIFIWNLLHSSDPVPSTRSKCNSFMIERNLRVLEAEQFCSCAEVRTPMDYRPFYSPSVFGCSSFSAIDSSSMQIGLGEAAKLYHEAVESGEIDGICEAAENYEIERILNGEAMGTCEAAESDEPCETLGTCEAIEDGEALCETPGTCEAVSHDEIVSWFDGDEQSAMDFEKAEDDDIEQLFREMEQKENEQQEPSELHETPAKKKEKNRFFSEINNSDFSEFLNMEKENTENYTFFRARELSLGDIDRTKNPALIRSCSVGILIKGERVIMLYTSPRINGLVWNRAAEETAVQNALLFCNKYLKTHLPNSDFIKEAIFFYRNDKELISALNGTAHRKKTIKYEDFGAPFQKVYAIPFSMQGQELLRFVLNENEPWKAAAKQYCLAHPDYEITGDEKSIYPISFLGMPVMQAYPLDIRALSRHITLDDDSREQVSIVDASLYEKVLKRTTPEIMIISD